MTDRDDVESLRADQAKVADLALEEIRALAARLDWSTPEAAHDALIEIVPAIVNEYGDIAATVAAEWYEDTRPMVLGPYTARTVDAASEEQIRGSLGALLGDSGTPDAALAAIQGGIRRLVQYSGRATIARNVQLDPGEVRFARIPTGGKTCAWCEMLASRGFVYYTRESAGALMQYHDSDDCALVASWEAEQEHIAGYDPDAMYDRYLAARDELEAEGNTAPTDKQIAGRLRRLFPEQYTDGIVTRPQQIPSEDTWRHILRGEGSEPGGGHLHGAGVPGKSEAPSRWTQQTFRDAILAIQDRGAKKRGTPPGVEIYDGVYDGVLLRVVLRDGEVRTAIPLRGDGVTQNQPGGRTDVPLWRKDRKAYNDLHDSGD
ncbi:hypothetical protein [Microbacterium sp.]|uniref:VG15 protein n=1 Tax=Microbacterium sp. TaxID=51671 RepID=UPI003A8F8808